MTPPLRTKILRVIARLNIGGPARQAVILHDGLRAAGFDTVLAFGSVAEGEGSFEDLLQAHGPGVRKIPELGRRIHLLSDLRAFARLVRLIFLERPDVVHTHTAKAGTLGRVAAALYNLTRGRRRRCLVVHTFHGHVLTGYFGPAGNLAVRFAERMLGSITDRVVTISPGQRIEIVERFRIVPAGKVSVVRLGLDLDRFFAIDGVDASLRNGLGFGPGSTLVGCVGRLVPIKDLPTLLEAFALARAGAPSLRLVVVGDGPERGPLEALSRRLGLDQFVRFVGWQRDLPGVYAGLDIVALSSRNEGTPVALIEAMAAGRPVVATAVGGVPDVVVPGESGVLVAAGDATGLAGALVRLAESAGERQRMGAAGRAAAGAYRQSQLLDALARLYREGLRAKRGVALTG